MRGERQPPVTATCPNRHGDLPEPSRRLARTATATRPNRHGGPNHPPDSRVPSFSRQLGKRRWVSAPQAGGHETVSLPRPPRRLTRTATATRPAHPPDVTRTTRQIPGYLLFLANWANAAGLVPRRLAGTNAPTPLWVAQSLPSVRFEKICLLRTPAFHAMLGKGSWPRSVSIDQLSERVML